MNICMVAYAYYESDNRIRRYSEELVRQGHSVDAIVIKHPGHERFALIEGVRVYRIQDREKNEYCGYLGLERANYLATLFGDGARWPAPSRLYAMDPIRPGSDNMKFWQADTLEPLAEIVPLPLKLAPGV